MEAIDELEAERDQQGDEQKKTGQVGRRLHAGRFDVRVQAIRHEQYAGAEESEEQDQCERIGRGIELRLVSLPKVGGAVQRCGDISHGVLEMMPEAKESG